MRLMHRRVHIHAKYSPIEPDTNLEGMLVNMGLVGTVEGMARRGSTMAAGAVILVGLLTGVGWAIGSRGEVRQDTPNQPDTTVPATAESEEAGTEPSGLSVYPQVEPGKPLNLPPLEINIDEWVTQEVPVNMTGVLWVQGKPTDVSTGVFENETQKSLYEDLAGCFPAREADPKPEELNAAKASCFDRKAVEIAASTPDPTDAFMALRGLSLARPDVFTLCHNASHKVGEIALRRLFAVRGADYETMYRYIQTGAIACQGGLVHGVYDALGKMKLTVEEFEPAVKACERNLQLAGQCSDAVGHASWDSFGEVPSTLKVCSYWGQTWAQQTCVEGVLMRMYQRLEPTDPFYSGAVKGAEADRFIRKTAAICLDWPDAEVANLLADPKTLCYQGMPYLLVKPILHLTETNGGNYALVKTEAKRLVGEIVKACGEYGEGSTYCTDRLSYYLLGATVFDVEEVAILCEVIPQNRETCVGQAEEKLANAEKGLG
jgi:hypothetical protein